MQKPWLPILLFTLLHNASARAQGCIGGASQYNAFMNNYRTTFLSGADQFWNLSYASTHVPVNSNCSPVVAAALWIGGYSQGGQLRVAAQTYRQNGMDFWPGPLDTINGSTSPGNCLSYDTYFPVRRAQVDSHRYHLYHPNLPSSIIGWPANKPAYSNLSYKLAPYADVNNNGVYDPVNGDYPIIYGDKTVYQIINDHGNKHDESGSASLGVEIHTSHYFLHCTSDSALWNTIFTHYDIINRSQTSYDSTRAGVWVDFSIGNYADDYIGCDTTLNLYYGYNGDSYDADTFGMNGYHQYLPAFGIKFLNRKMTSFSQYADTNYIDPPASNQPSAYYSLLKGLFKNGAPIFDSADGSAGSHSTKFFFPGDPVSNTGWTEGGAAQTPGNRNGIGAFGSTTFKPGDTLKLDLAYIFADNYSSPGNNTAAVTKLKQYAQTVQNYYDSGLAYCDTLKYTPQPECNLDPFPNPTCDYVFLNCLQATDAMVYVYDVRGREVYSGPLTDYKIDVRTFPSGVYPISLVTGNSVIKKKIVVIR